jgi:hypothetical protein
VDNLLRYLYNHFGNRLAVSGETGDLLIWGERINNGVRLLGLSFNISRAMRTTRGHGDLLFSCGKHIASKINLPILHIIYPSDLQTNPRATLLINGQSVAKNDAQRTIQALFGTRQTILGTAKDVNKRTNDVFQDWARDNLPRDYVRNDIDAILLTQAYEPSKLIEVKRSTQVPPTRWTPFTNDARNYYMGNLLAQRAGLDFITLNHANKDIPVDDETTVGIHFIDGVSLNPDRIRSRKTLVNARELVTMFQKQQL